MSAMRISTKGRYAVRVMLDLALNDTGDSIKVKQIAQRQEISEKYLEQIIAVLNKAGYVKSTRGAQGGYRLAMAPSQYTVGQILRLTEGSLTPSPCLDECAGGGECPRQDCCEAAGVWKQLADAISGVVDQITLEELVNRRREHERGRRPETEKGQEQSGTAGNGQEGNGTAGNGQEGSGTAGNGQEENGEGPEAE